MTRINPEINRELIGTDAHDEYLELSRLKTSAGSGEWTKAHMERFNQLEVKLGIISPPLSADSNALLMRQSKAGTVAKSGTVHPKLTSGERAKLVQLHSPKPKNP